MSSNQPSIGPKSFIEQAEEYKQQFDALKREVEFLKADRDEHCERLVAVEQIDGGSGRNTIAYLSVAISLCALAAAVFI